MIFHHLFCCYKIFLLDSFLKPQGRVNKHKKAQFNWAFSSHYGVVLVTLYNSLIVATSLLALA